MHAYRIRMHINYVRVDDMNENVISHAAEYPTAGTGSSNRSKNVQLT